MKNVIIRVCYIKGEKVVEVILGDIAYLITASEPRKLMREARKFIKANGYTLTDIIYI